MSTKSHTDTSNVYNQGSMKAYNAFQPNLMSYYMQALNNPLGTSYFKNQLAQQQAQVRQLQGNAVRNTLQNARAGGGILSNSAGFTSALLNRQAIGGNLMQANAFNSALNNALNTRNWAAGAMASYQPLQTGQNSVQYKSGVGTWLGPIAGMATNLLMPGIGGMMSGAGFMGGMRGAYGGGGGFTPGPTMSAPQLPFGGAPGGMGIGNAFSAAMTPNMPTFPY